MRVDEADPKGLVREAYAIEGITPPECRSILLDWALGLPGGTDVPDALRALLAHYGPTAPDHPMTGVMTEGLTPADSPRRKGGRAARLGA